jgi:hypothetical protein
MGSGGLKVGVLIDEFIRVWLARGKLGSISNSILHPENFNLFCQKHDYIIELCDFHQ